MWLCSERRSWWWIRPCQSKREQIGWRLKLDLIKPEGLLLKVPGSKGSTVALCLSAALDLKWVNLPHCTLCGNASKIFKSLVESTISQQKPLKNHIYLLFQNSFSTSPKFCSIGITISHKLQSYYFEKCQISQQIKSFWRILFWFLPKITLIVFFFVI